MKYFILIFKEWETNRMDLDLLSLVLAQKQNHPSLKNRICLGEHPLERIMPVDGHLPPTQKIMLK